MWPRMTHVALHVENLDRCVDFYRRYCKMEIIHERTKGTHSIVWMAEPGREKDFIFVIMNRGENLHLSDCDYRHFGFAVESKEAVDAIAAKAKQDGVLVWEPVDEPYPVGYYCGLQDPNGNYVEFSFGQPLGPGAE